MPIEKRTIFASIALIVILGFSLYFNSLNGKFLWDDKYLVKENKHIQNFSYVPKVFTENIGTGAHRTYHFYRPLQTLSYMIDYSIWKLDVKGYHLTNILLHILVALAIYWLVSILFKDTLLSFLASIFFLAHPIHAGPISYISARANSMVALFMFLAFVFYIKSLDAKKPILLLLMILSYIASLLSRENSLILPVLLLVYHLAFQKKIKLKPFVTLAGMSLVYIVLRAGVFRYKLTHEISNSTIGQRMPGVFVALANYLRILCAPFHLHVDYGEKLFSWNNPQAIIGVLLFLGLVALVWKNRKGKNLVFFSISWFFVALIPLANIYPINAYMSVGWLHVPSIGFFLLLAKALSYLLKTQKFRAFALILIITLISFYSGLTIRENTYWREPKTLYERTLKYVPDSEMAYNNLGILYGDMKNFKKAISLFEKAVKLNPKNGEPHHNLGQAYSFIGNREKAIASYDRAVELYPDPLDDARTYHRLGDLYNDIGDQEEAISSYKKAIESNPNYLKAYNNLGALYSSRNEIEKAVEVLTKLIEIDPQNAGAYINLSAAHYRSGKYELAVQYFHKAQSLGMNSPALLEVLKPYLKNKLGVISQ
ncbi:tetratricopeptide repeat protein [Candidatus Omnitrophota bacterium]